MLPLAAGPVVQTWMADPQWMACPNGLLLGLGLAVLLTALYAGLPGDHGIRYALRRWPGMKLLWIGWVWGLVTAVWPACLAAVDPPPDTWEFTLLFAERACTIMALTLPFDLRDRAWDPPEFRTWPQRWGERGTRLLAFFLLALSAGATGLLTGPNPAFLIGHALMVPAVLYAAEDRKSWYYLLLDGLLVIDGCLLLMLR